MSFDKNTLRAKNIALLTETLPYEVPIIFSNDTFFSSRISKSISVSAKKELDIILCRHRDTRPYSYKIEKGNNSTNQLSVVHPTIQIEISELYSSFEETLLHHCSASRQTSLRRPSGVFPIFSKDELSGKKIFNSGVPHFNPAEGQIDVSNFRSYFKYEKHILLAQFFDSLSYRNLESKFRYMRSIDVNKCFFNIYTHSITWAVGQKDFAKKQKDNFSFESHFDKLMQRSNYNETNGIIVGPEFSRIFAEIIFQDIDVKSIKNIKSEHSLEFGVDYEFKRYVDDIYIFCNSLEKSDLITKSYANTLAKYKLYLNESKTQDYERPLITQQTQAKFKLVHVLQQLKSCFDDLDKNDKKRNKTESTSLVELLNQIRILTKENKTQYYMISGQAFGAIRGNINKLKSRKIDYSDELIRIRNFNLLLSALDICFFMLSVDFRVRSCFHMIHIFSICRQIKEKFPIAESDSLDDFIAKKLIDILSVKWAERDQHQIDHIEIGNLLIAGSFYCGSSFYKHPTIVSILSGFLSSNSPSYFQFIAVKFCFLRDPVFYDASLVKLNDTVIKFLSSNFKDSWNDTNTFLLFCDTLSSPDLTKSTRRSLYELIKKNPPSNAIIAEVSKSLTFVDWEGSKIFGQIKRKALRPVYSFG
jgi:hypothetical protein